LVSVATSLLRIFTPLLPTVAGVALDALGNRKVHYFVIITLADFSFVLRNAVSVTLSVFLIIQSYTRYLRNPGRAAHSANKNQGKSEKQILIDWRVLGSGKWKF
jgi:hypothetical protein